MVLSHDLSALARQVLDNAAFEQSTDSDTQFLARNLGVWTNLGDQSLRETLKNLRLSETFYRICLRKLGIGGPDMGISTCDAYVDTYICA